MKKLLLLFVTLTSFMTHAMESTYAKATADRPVHVRRRAASDFIGQGNPEKGVIYVTAETPLGTISKVLSGQSIRYILLGKVSLEFNKTEKTFDGVRDGQWIKNPTEAETLFNQYKTVFDATEQKSISFFSTTMDDWD